MKSVLLVVEIDKSGDCQFQSDLQLPGTNYEIEHYGGW